VRPRTKEGDLKAAPRFPIYPLDELATRCRFGRSRDRYSPAPSRIRDRTVGPARPGTGMLAIVARGRATFIILSGRDFAQLNNDRDRDVDKPDRKAVRAGELESRDGLHVGRSGYAKFI
jgi:hypothetical protein